MGTLTSKHTHTHTHMMALLWVVSQQPVDAFADHFCN